MKAINLFELTRICNQDIFNIFENHLSKRNNLLKIQEHEIQSIIELVKVFEANDCEYDIFNNFYYSFEIPQIGKEFDLLRINNEKVINIELKSIQVEEIQLKEQLIKNKYYLSHISNEIFLFTFIAENKKLYYLNNVNEVIEIEKEYLIEILKAQNNCFCDNINKLFKPSAFLISPLNTPERFLNKEYFLTSQQEYFKKQILKNYETDLFVGITGDAGTGKTLLLYDLALTLAAQEHCCIIHCGNLCEGHEYIKKSNLSIDILAAKDLSDNSILHYSYIFIDEAQRFYKEQFEKVINITRKRNIPVTFSFDAKQTLSHTEQNTNTVNLIKNLPNYIEYKLSNKIRTNKEIASFISRLFNLNSNKTCLAYPSISILYANNQDEAITLLKNYTSNDYTFINYTSSTYYKGDFDVYSNIIYSHNTHYVIGQEFDNVIMLMDKNFIYNENNKLVPFRHPNPNYIYSQLLLQGLTRTREKLTIIIIDNENLFKKILSIINNTSNNPL